MRRSIWLILVCIISLIPVSCAAEGLLQGVKAEKDAYDLGDKVVFEFALRNTGSTPLTYRFSSSKQFDLWVTQGNDELFRLSRGKMYTQALTHLTLQPGETKTFTAEWDQRDWSGSDVGPGIYTVHAQLTTATNAPLPVTARVKLGASGATIIPITVRLAINSFNQLSGRKVMLMGVYRGWSPDPGDPNTKDGPPVTRSDWAVSDDTGCMYVTGNSKLDPQKDQGTSVGVIGTLQRTDRGQVYMILESINIGTKGK